MSNPFRAVALALAVVGALAPAGCVGTEPAPVNSGVPEPSGSTAPAIASASVPASVMPSVAPPVSAEMRGWHYSCDEEVQFSPALFEGPATAELAPDPAAARLRQALAQGELGFEGFPRSGYWLVSRTAIRADYIARTAGRDAAFAYVAFAFVDGAWIMQGVGRCSPTLVLDGFSLATWTFDPAMPRPGPDASRFDALVTERSCASGKPMLGRLRPPSIDYAVDAITIVFFARPLRGDQDCPGNPSARVTIELREQIGERPVLDGAFFPPADPNAPAS
jgi:hypothetical protein